MKSTAKYDGSAIVQGVENLSIYVRQGDSESLDTALGEFSERDDHVLNGVLNGLWQENNAFIAEVRRQVFEHNYGDVQSTSLGRYRRVRDNIATDLTPEENVAGNQEVIKQTTGNQQIYDVLTRYADQIEKRAEAAVTTN
jgi:hypothetical protein